MTQGVRSLGKRYQKSQTRVQVQCGASDVVLAVVAEVANEITLATDDEWWRSTMWPARLTVTCKCSAGRHEISTSLLTVGNDAPQFRVVRVRD